MCWHFTIITKKYYILLDPSISYSALRFTLHQAAQPAKLALYTCIGYKMIFPAVLCNIFPAKNGAHFLQHPARGLICDGKQMYVFFDNIQA